MSKNIKEYTTYLSPEYIYIPYDDVNLLKLNKNRKVYNNLFLGNLKNGNNIFSPVSGEVISAKEMTFTSGNKNCLVIENDFIDKRAKLNPSINISKVKKSEIKNQLIKYNLYKNIDSKTTLVVNSLYDKNTDLKDVVINYESYEEILEAIDEFMEIFNISNCYLCIDRNDIYSISSYEKYANAFMNICIVNSIKKLKNDKYITYTIEEILAIHKAIHQDYMYDNTIITITYKEPLIIKVKLYTSLSELLDVLKISHKNKNVFINNKEISNIENFIIDSNVRSVVIKDKK